METALNLASVVFLGTLFFGVVIAVYGLVTYLSRRRFVVPAPVIEKLPTRAMDRAKHALDQLKADFYRATGAKRTRLGHEVQRLEMRVQHLNHRTQEDQYPYYQLCRRREKVWRDWRRAFDRLEFLHGQERKAAQRELTHLVHQCQEVDKLTRDEWHRARARDDLALEELESQGVLQRDATPPDEPTGEGAEHLGSMEAAEDGPFPDADDNEAAARARKATAALEAEQVAPETNSAPQPGEATTPRTPGGQPVAVMHQADFAHADLPKSGMRYADTDFNSALVPGGRLEDANLSGCSFAGVRFVGTQVFRRINLSRADLRNIALPRAEQPHQFVDCDFSSVHFGGAHLEYVLFLRCNFAYSQWAGVRLDRVKFSDCDITGTRWDGIDLSRTVMSHDMIRQGDFSGAVQPPREPQPSPYDRAAGGVPAHTAPLATPHAGAPAGTAAPVTNAEGTDVPAPGAEEA